MSPIMRLLTTLTTLALISWTALGCQTVNDDSADADAAASTGGQDQGDDQAPLGSGGTVGEEPAQKKESELDVPLSDPPPTEEEEVEEIEPDEPQVETIDNCAQTKVTALDTTELIPADIIIAVDMSSSMAVEAVFVQEQLNQFSQQIISSGVDAHVVLLAMPTENGFGIPLDPVCVAAPLGSGTCPDDNNLPGYMHLEEHVGSFDALNRLIETFPLWQSQLRPGALKAFLVVSDDNATAAPNNNAATFTANLEALDPDLFARWNMNAVYSFSMCTDAGGQALAASIGTVYEELVTQTGGVAGDLCAQDFQPVFDKLATQIVENAGAEIVCEWEIPAAVPGQTFSTDLVEVFRTSGDDIATAQSLGRVLTVDECAAGGWYFDDNYNPARISACESTCAGMQDDKEGGIEVAFGCEVVEGCTASGEAHLIPEPAVAAGETACAWAIPQPEAGSQVLDPETVNVRYTSTNGFSVLMGAVEGAEACAAAELGWHYDAPTNPKKIIACPQTCDVLTSRQMTQVNALFGCQTRPAPPVR